MRNIWILKPYIKKNIRYVILTSLLLVILSIVSVIPAKMTQLIIDNGFLAYNYRYIIMGALILTASYLIKSFLSYKSNIYFTVIGTNIVKEFRKDVYNKVLYLNLELYSKMDSGYISARINETGSVAALFNAQTFSLITGSFEFIVSFIILANMHTTLLLIMCIPIPFLFFASYKMMTKLKKSINKTLESSAQYQGKITEVINGIEKVKEANTEKMETEKLDTYNNKMLEKSKKQAITLSLMTQILTSMNYAIIVILYILGGHFFINKSLSLGEFTAFSMYVGKLYAPFIGFSTATLTIQPALVSINRITDFAKEIEVVPNKSRTKINFIDCITYKDVSMSYKESQFVFNNLNFSIHQGDKCLIKGSNGVGKSTIVKLLLKLYTPTFGEIDVNGINIKNIDTESLIDSMSYVPQKIFLFNDTIKNNILYGLKDVSKNDYAHIVELIGLSELFKKLPNGDNTIVGANGFKLSGGQIQKIAIAKTLLKKANCFIFDEAISSLDDKSKKELRKIILNSNSQNIIIIIDHSNFFDDLCNKVINLDS